MNLVWVVPAVIAPGALMAARTVWRERRRLPAAPDNQAGSDPGLLWECRRINALPPTSRKERKP